MASGDAGLGPGSVCADFASRATETPPSPVGDASIVLGSLLCSVMSGTRHQEDD